MVHDFLKMANGLRILIGAFLFAFCVIVQGSSEGNVEVASNELAEIQIEDAERMHAVRFDDPDYIPVALSPIDILEVDLICQKLEEKFYDTSLYPNGSLPVLGVHIQLQQAIGEGSFTDLGESIDVTLSDKKIITGIHMFDVINDKSYVKGAHLRFKVSTKSVHAVAFTFHLLQLHDISRYQVIFALVLLIFLYVMIVADFFPRTIIAMAGCVLALIAVWVLRARPPLEVVVSWVDTGAIWLLLGMMIVVGMLSATGFFEYCAVIAFKVSKGKMWRLLVILSCVSAVLSAFLDNVTTILLLSPVTLRLSKVINISPIPYILSQVLFSNIGGTATMVGDPPNIIIGNYFHKELVFLDFLINLTPPLIICGLATMLVLRYFYVDELLARDKENKEKQQHPKVVDGKPVIPSTRQLASGTIGEEKPPKAPSGPIATMKTWITRTVPRPSVVELTSLDANMRNDSRLSLASLDKDPETLRRASQLSLSDLNHMRNDARSGSTISITDMIQRSAANQREGSPLTPLEDKEIHNKKPPIPRAPSVLRWADLDGFDEAPIRHGSKLALERNQWQPENERKTSIDAENVQSDVPDDSHDDASTEDFENSPPSSPGSVVIHSIPDSPPRILVTQPSEPTLDVQPGHGQDEEKNTDASESDKQETPEKDGEKVHKKSLGENDDQESNEKTDDSTNTDSDAVVLSEESGQEKKPIESTDIVLELQHESDQPATVTTHSDLPPLSSPSNHTTTASTQTENRHLSAISSFGSVADFGRFQQDLPPPSVRERPKSKKSHHPSLRERKMSFTNIGKSMWQTVFKWSHLNLTKAEEVGASPNQNAENVHKQPHGILRTPSNLDHHHTKSPLSIQQPIQHSKVIAGVMNVPTMPPTEIYEDGVMDQGLTHRKVEGHTPAPLIPPPPIDEEHDQEVEKDACDKYQEEKYPGFAAEVRKKRGVEVEFDEELGLGSIRTFGDQIRHLENQFQIKDRSLARKSLIVLGMVVLAFCLQSVHGMEPAWIAMLGAVLLLILAKPKELEPFLAKVEWGTLIFFSALFIFIESCVHLGLIRSVTSMLGDVIADVEPESRLPVALLLIMWLSAILSAFIDNVPWTATMVPVIAELAEDESVGLPLRPLIWALSLGACLGGNGSLIGASANIVAAGCATAAGYPISFRLFFKWGFPVMILTCAIASVWIIVIYHYAGLTWL